MAGPFLPNCHGGMKRIEQSGIAVPEGMVKPLVAALKDPVASVRGAGTLSVRGSLHPFEARANPASF